MIKKIHDFDKILSRSWSFVNFIRVIDNSDVLSLGQNERSAGGKRADFTSYNTRGEKNSSWSMVRPGSSFKPFWRAFGLGFLHSFILSSATEGFRPWWMIVYLLWYPSSPIAHEKYSTDTGIGQWLNMLSFCSHLSKWRLLVSCWVSECKESRGVDLYHWRCPGFCNELSN